MSHRVASVDNIQCTGIAPADGRSACAVPAGLDINFVSSTLEKSGGTIPHNKLAAFVAANNPISSDLNTHGLQGRGIQQDGPSNGRC